jgi:hypothetical protein
VPLDDIAVPAADCAQVPQTVSSFSAMKARYE